MNYVFTLCISYLVLGLLAFFIHKFKKKHESKMTRDDFVVKFPNIVPIISLICSLFFLLILVLMLTVLYNETVTLVPIIFFVVFIFLGFAGYVLAKRVRLIVKGNNITYYPPFSPKKELTFDDITSIMWDNLQGLICYKGDKKLFAISNMGVQGFDLFQSRVRQHLYQKNKKTTETE